MPESLTDQQIETIVTNLINNLQTRNPRISLESAQRILNRLQQRINDIRDNQEF